MAIRYTGTNISAEQMQVVLSMTSDTLENYEDKCPYCGLQTVEVNWRVVSDEIEILVRCGSEE